MKKYFYYLMLFLIIGVRLPYLYEDGIFTNTTNTIQCLDNNLTCQPIAIGSYPIHSAVGYDNYVYIDLE